MFRNLFRRMFSNSGRNGISLQTKRRTSRCPVKGLAVYAGKIIRKMERATGIGPHSPKANKIKALATCNEPKVKQVL